MELRNSRVETSDLDQSQQIQNPDGGVAADAPAATAAAADGGNASGAVKRKRGRPPKAQVKAVQPAAKKSKEEDEDEDVCFICFDGGSLVLCDRRFVLDLVLVLIVILFVLHILGVLLMCAFIEVNVISVMLFELINE